MNQFHEFILAWKSTCFRQFLCPSSGVFRRTLSSGICHTAFEQDQDEIPWSSILVLLESCLQTCMTYTIAERTVNKLLMMDRGTVWNM
jgi:hypothetical protein